MEVERHRFLCHPRLTLHFDQREGEVGLLLPLLGAEDVWADRDGLQGLVHGAEGFYEAKI